MDIRNIIMCPECRSDLTPDLKCPKCGNQYSYKHGVYNLISLNISGKAKALYRGKIPDDSIPLWSPKDEWAWQNRIDEYYSLYNEESTVAMQKQDEYVQKLIGSMSGDVCDFRTGGGIMLQKILDAENSAVSSIVCTYINVYTLMETRDRRNGDRDNISYVATDQRRLSLKDESFDYVLSGFGNAAEADKSAKELYRILKPGGKIIIQGAYIDKDSKSCELAKSVGIERGMVEEYILSDLESAGFKNIKSTVVAEAVWAENPYDLIPATGDKQRYYVIEAEKI